MTVDDQDRVLRMLGLATRAGKTAYGAVACEKAVTRGRAELVIVATDAARDTAEKAENMCHKAGIPCLRTGTGATIGQYTGGGIHMTAAVLDRGFAQRIRELWMAGTSKMK